MCVRVRCERKTFPCIAFVRRNPSSTVKGVQVWAGLSCVLKVSQNNGSSHVSQRVRISLLQVSSVTGEPSVIVTAAVMVKRSIQEMK